MYLSRTIPPALYPNSQICVRRKELWEVCGLGLQVLQYCKTYILPFLHLVIFFTFFDSDEVSILRLDNRCLKITKKIFLVSKPFFHNFASLYNST